MSHVCLWHYASLNQRRYMSAYTEKCICFITFSMDLIQNMDYNFTSSGWSYGWNMGGTCSCRIIMFNCGWWIKKSSSSINSSSSSHNPRVVSKMMMMEISKMRKYNEQCVTTMADADMWNECHSRGQWKRE